MDQTPRKDKKNQAGRWSKEEHQRFMLGLMTYGKDWKKVQQLVATRSGSQKFFNKLHKQEQGPTCEPGQCTLSVAQNVHSKKDPEPVEISGSQVDTSYLHEDQASPQSSTGISFMIRKHSSGKNQVNIQNLKKELHHSMQKSQIETASPTDEALNIKKMVRRNSYMGMSNVLSAYQGIIQQDKVIKDSEAEDESFLLRLAKKYQRFFEQGGQISNLIDFGKQKSIGQQQEPQQRKRSFTLPKGVQGNQQDLNQRRKKIISSCTTGSLPQNQKQLYKVIVCQAKRQFKEKADESQV